MKTTFKLIFLFLALTAIGHAQYYPQYESSTTISGDANSMIYVTVVVDGTTTGTCTHPCPPCGQWGCSTCNYPGCPGDHTPYIYNVLNGGGGWTTGPAVSMFGYMSYQVTSSTQGQDGVMYTASTEGKVYCPVGGYILDSGLGNWNIQLAYTKSQFYGPPEVESSGDLKCNLHDWCLPANSPPTCSNAYVIQSPPITGGTATCWPYYNSQWLAWRTVYGTTYSCFPLIPGQNAVGTSDPSFGACTKLP